MIHTRESTMAASLMPLFKSPNNVADSMTLPGSAEPFRVPMSGQVVASGTVVLHDSMVLP